MRGAARIAAAVSFSLLAARPIIATDPEILAMERRVWELVNAERTTRGIPLLRFDEQLAGVAREHSRDMADGGFFSHESPRTGSASDRIFSAGIPASATAENIALNVSVAAAHETLMKSASHRANILFPGYDSLGVGVVRRGRSLYMTECFCKALARVDPLELTRKVYRAINARRRQKGLGELAVHRGLEAIAQEVARRQDAGQALLSRLPGQLLKAQGLEIRQFWSWVSLNASARPVLEIREISRSTLNRIGVGIVVNRTREKGLGMLWIVVLLAEMP